MASDWPGLAATLAGFDDTRLARLLALRPDLMSPPPRDWSVLASRAGAWPSARDCYRELDRAAQRAAEALCLLPQAATVDDLADLLGVPAADADLASAVTRLEDRALVFRSDAEPAQLRLLAGMRQLDHPAGLGPPLSSVLQGTTGPALDLLARRLGAEPARTMADTFAVIAGILSDPDTVARLVAQGPAGTEDLARRVAVDGPLVSVTGGMYGVTDKTPAGWLVSRGLVGVKDYYSGVMAREPAIALRGGRVFPAGCLRRPEARLATVDAGAVDRTAAERAMTVVGQVAAVLDLWSTEPPAVLKAGGLGIREVRRAAKAMDRTEREAAHVIELAAVAGLVRVDIAGDALPTVAYDEWLGLESPDRWAWLATAWLEADLHISLAGAISTKDKPIAPLLDRAPERAAGRRRRLVLGVLGEAAPGQAPAPGSVHERVDWDCPAMWAGGPAQPQMLMSWVLAETELLGVTGLGSLSSAGRALIAGRGEEASAALAALVPPAVTQFVIQADLTAVIAGEPATEVRTELDLVADVESKGAATVYRFGEASVRRAFDAGRTAEGILAFLEAHATRGVPQPLAYLVADVGRRFGIVRVGAATSYVRSDDPALLAEVLQARATTKLRLRALAPTVLVSPADAATVTSTLQAAGYLPAHEAADGSLLLARPPARRLPVRPAPAWRPAAAPEPAKVVAELRMKPLAPPPPPVFEMPLPGTRSAVRPADIARTPMAVRYVLGQACEEFWLVRMAYLSTSGGGSELTVEPVDIDARHLYATCFPDGDERRFVVDRIEWVRVLTEAEEALF